MSAARKVLAVAAMAAVPADAFTTWLFLHRGTGVEGNPVVAASIAALGVVLALGLWSAARLVALTLIARVRVPLVPELLLGALAVWSWVVVAWNLHGV